MLGETAAGDLPKDGCPASRVLRVVSVSVSHTTLNNCMKDHCASSLLRAPSKPGKGTRIPQRGIGGICSKVQASEAEGW